MPEKDISQEAKEQVNGVTGSDTISGEQLLGSPELRQRSAQTKEQELQQAKLEGLKEDIFRAWKTWDCEVDEINAKNAAKVQVELAIDKYKEAINSKAARWSFFLRLGPEYADWRQEED